MIGPLLLALALPAAASPETDLGRALFYDPRLSANRAVSCATCHNPSLAWRDGLPQGRGPSLEELGVRVPSLLSVPAKRYESGARAALTSPRGLDRDPEALARDLSRLPGYARAFAQAEGGPPTAERAAKALAAFLREAMSVPDPELSAEAKRGEAVFRGKAACSSCHDSKAPGLRGVAATAPYGHEGRWLTLSEASEHGMNGKNLTDPERADLLSYLRGLRPPEILPAIPPLPLEGEVSAVVAYSPSGQTVAPGAVASADEGLAPLAAADKALSDAESVAVVLRGDAAQKKCAAAVAPEALYASLETGRLAGAALGRLPETALDAARTERLHRALADGRPAACEVLSVLADARLGFFPEDAADCRASALDLAAARALAAREPGYPLLCRQALAAERPEVPVPDAAAACATVFARVAEPARLCAELPPSLLKGSSVKDCIEEFTRYSRPPAAPRENRGALAATLDRLAAAAAKRDPAACGNDSDCSAALDPKAAATSAAAGLIRVRDLACAAVARPDAAPADPEYAKRRIADARAALERARAAWTPGDRDGAAAIDEREERAARLEYSLHDAP